MSCDLRSLGVESPVCEPDNALVYGTVAQHGAAHRISRFTPEQLREKYSHR